MAPAEPPRPARARIPTVNDQLPIRRDVEFKGSDEEYRRFSAQARELGLTLDVQDRDRSRGVGDVLVTLVLVGASRVIERLIDEFAENVWPKQPSGPDVGPEEPS